MQHAERVRKPLLPIDAARANPQRVSFADLPAPPFTGTRIVEPDLETLMRFVDWQFFFHAWELKGKFPAILERPEAKELYDDALALLEEITVARSLRPRGVYGFWPARSEGDDVVLEDGTRFCFLRQQSDYGDSRPNRCLADYVAPPGSLGAFAVGIHGAGRAGSALRGRARRLPLDHGQGARRPARGGVRRVAARRGAEGVVCARRGALEARSWSGERYRGIRPAFGYPACPDHSEKEKLFALLGAADAGLELTETFATTPAASVSGIYFAHPESRYFAVGRIGLDQVDDYARPEGRAARRGGTLATAEPRLRGRGRGRAMMDA